MTECEENRTVFRTVRHTIRAVDIAGVFISSLQFMFQKYQCGAA